MRVISVGTGWKETFELHYRLEDILARTKHLNSKKLIHTRRGMKIISRIVNFSRVQIANDSR